MGEVKWIKITTDIFDDEKILLIESMPAADSIITIWFKLLSLAGKQNNSGVFLMNDKIAYTDEMLSTIFRRDLNTVRLALKTFEQFGMIEIINGIITIPNWSKHQTLDSYEKKKERDRLYQAERRARQRALAQKDSDTVIPDKDIVSSKDIQRILAAWNELKTIGIKPISKLNNSSKRYGNLVARIREYSVEDILLAIKRIKESSYCQGKNRYGWTITFDWFVLPSNFPKVLEGNYSNRETQEANVFNEWRNA